MGERYHVPPEILQELHVVNDLQDLFLSIEEDNFEEVLEEITNYYIDGPNVRKDNQFIDHYVNSLRIRPLRCKIMALFFKHLIGSESFQHLDSLLIEKMCNDFRCEFSFPTACPLLIFLWHCYELEIYSKEDIVMLIYTIYNSSKKNTTTLTWLFFWFAPELFETSSNLYERIIHLITLFNPRDYLHNYLFNNFNQLSKNDWALLKEKRKNLKPEHKLATILQNDDIEALKSEMIHPDFDIDEIIPESFLEPVWMLQHHPSLIQYAAFYNAINCFKYLLMSGANLRYVDSVNRTLPQFAVCNGNIEIFRLCQQFCPIQGADHTAIAFHQNGLFIWLHESYNTDLSQVHPQRGSTLSRIMSEWNYEVLFYVLEKGYDLGFVDTTNKTLLNYACYFGSLELIHFLISLNIFDINYHVPNITLPPLYDAIFSGFYEIVEFFLTIPGIDLTIETSYGNAYDIAASIGHLEIFQLLVTTFPDDCNLLTVLPNALSSQSCQLVQYVVSICPDFDFHDFSTDFYSALEEAVSLRNFELTLYLVEDLNIIDESFSASNYKSIVNKACSITDCEIFHLLFKYKGNYLRIYDIRHFLSNATKVTPNKISHFLYRYYTELQNGTITL